MSAQNGNLHIVRQRITIAGDSAPNEIDTGIKVANRAYNQTGGPADPVDPPLGLEQAAAPANGATPASRVMVIVLPPTPAWADLVIGEPWLDTDTGTVKVNFTKATEGNVDINVLFWAPHTCCGPVKCDTYNAPIG